MAGLRLVSVCDTAYSAYGYMARNEMHGDCVARNTADAEHRIVSLVLSLL